MVTPCSIHLKFLLRENAGTWIEAGERNANYIGNALSLCFACNMQFGQNHFCFMSHEVTVSPMKQLKLGDAQAS